MNPAEVQAILATNGKQSPTLEELVMGADINSHETVTRHDMRHLYWGRSWNVRQDGKGILRGLTHCTPPPKVGDEVIWRTPYGEAIGRLTEVEWCRDPDDMWRVACEVIERRQNPHD